MSRRACSRLLAVVVALAVAACGSTTAGATPSPSAAAAGTSALPASPVVGIVTHVDSAGLNDVRAFTLRTSSGQILQFAIGQLQDPTVFPPGHLVEHQVTAEPVRVTFEVRDGALVAVKLADAAGTSGSPGVSGSPGASG